MLTLAHMTTPVTFYKAPFLFFFLFFSLLLGVNGLSGSEISNEQRALFAETRDRSAAFSASAFKLKLPINFS